ncbi:MAG: transposase family protein [Ekhidna sp.]
MNPTLITIDGNNYIASNELEKLGSSSEEIENGIQDYLNGKSAQWKCFWKTDQNETFIDLVSLPDRIRKKLKCDLSVDLNVIQPLSPLNGMQTIDLLTALKEGYKDFLVHYQNFKKDKCEKYAKKHSILHKCCEMYISNKGKRGTMLWLYKALRNLKIEYYEDLDSFRRKLRQILNSRKRFPELIIHGSEGNSNLSVRKVTKWHKLKAMDLLSQGYLKKEILSIMNKSCGPGQRISYSSLLRLITKKMENLTAEDRYGYKFFKENLEPYIRRQKPKYKFQVVEADGTRFQIPYYEEGSEYPKFLILYVIIDVFSSMILGYSIGKREDTQLVLDAFHMMLKVHSYMPACVIVDKSSSHQSNDFQEFRDLSNKYFGTLWREHLPDFPNAKGTVENFNFNLNVQIVRNHPDYLGLSMHAKSKDHVLRRDKYQTITKKKKKLLSEDRLRHLISTIINKWNCTITKEKSPEQKHNLGEILDAKTINEEQIARLCWSSVDKKVRRSRIIQNNKEYAIDKNQNRAKWNGSVIQVFYHSNHPEHVFLFDGDEFIEKCQLKRNYSEHDPSKFNQIKKNKDFREYCGSKVKENRQELHEFESSNSIFPAITSSKEEANEAYEKFLYEELENQDSKASETPEVNALPTPKL